MFLPLGCDWVALVMMRYRLSPRVQPRNLNTGTMFKQCLAQAETSQTAFSFSTPPLEVPPSLLTDCVQHCSLLSLRAVRPLGFEIIALHRNFSLITFFQSLFSNHFCVYSRCLCLYVVTNGYTRDNGPSVARPPESRYPNQACQPRAHQKHPSCTRNI
jgi:hypothetical protein